MKKQIVTLAALMVVLSVHSQKKSEKFILLEPKIEFKDLTTIPVLRGSISNQGSKIGEFYEKIKSDCSDPLAIQRRSPDFEPTEINDAAKSKREEFSKLATYDNFKKYHIIQNPEKYSIDDIKYLAIIKFETVTKLPRTSSGITCYVSNGDTLVINRIENRTDGYGKSRIIVTDMFKPHISLQQYIDDSGLTDKLKTMIIEYELRWINDLRFNQQLKSLSDETMKLNDEELRLYNVAIESKVQQNHINHENQVAEAKIKHMIGNIEYQFTEPTGPVLTKSGTNPMGANVTYEYYINENGYEVKHGKQTIVMTFKNHKYWTGDYQYGWIYVNGSETLIEYYRNGILHGQLTYKCNIDTDSTFGNEAMANRSYNLSIHKGFLSGNFKFSYNGITYTGKAINGILEYCDYETNDGFHGKLTSNPKSNNVSVANINNGYRTFEFDSNIQLPSGMITVSSFRFPLIGN